MRIAVFDVFAMGGGVPVVAGRLVKGLRDYFPEHDVLVVDPFDDIKSLMQLPQNMDVQLVSMPMDSAARELARETLLGRMKGASALVCAGLRLGRLCSQYQVDCLVFNLPKSGVVAGIAKRVSSVDTVFYCHGVQFVKEMNAMYRWILHDSDHVIAVSDGTKQQLQAVGVPPEGVAVVYNSVDTASYGVPKNEELKGELGIPDQAFLVGCVGNLIRRKGIDVLVEAFAEFVNLADGPVHLLIVGGDPGEGSGSYRAQIDRCILKHGLTDMVTFSGFRADVPELLGLLDLFVMPSRMESFGVAIVEALASKLPVIATRTGSIPEVIKDGITGILVPGEDPQAMGRAMYDLYTQPILRRCLASHGADDVAQRFSVKAQAKAFLAALRESDLQ